MELQSKTAILVAQKIAKVRLLRDGFKREQAHELVNELIEELEAYAGENASIAKAEAHYERGMVHNAYGRYTETIEDMRLCAGHGVAAEDVTWELIGEFRICLTQYLSGQVCSAEAYTQLCGIRQKQIEKSHLVSSERRPNFNDNVENCAKRRTELAFENSLPEFQDLAVDFLDFPNLQGAHLKTEVGNWPLIVRNQTKGRLEWSRGRVHEAIMLLTGHLNIDKHFGLKSFIEEDHRSKFQRVAHETMQEVARDYRDLGKLVLETEINNKHDIALSVWKIGLDVDSGRGNALYVKQIQTLVDAYEET